VTKTDVYQEVTDRIVAQLEAGVIPWQKPWNSASGLPVSLSTGKPYRGVNVLLLGLAPYADPRWGTYRAILNAGGQVRKGQKGTQIILWKPVARETKNEAGEAEESRYMLLRQYTVFNAEQADGLPELPTIGTREHTADEECEAIVKGYKMGPAIHHGGDRACYSPSADNVRMPAPEDFDTSADYYQTLFHELIHSTGHESRLDRLEPALFGTDPYAKEELVAELGASMLAGLAGLETAAGENSAAYVGAWIQRLKDDRKLIITAAAQAQKGADHILGTTFDDKEAKPLAEAVAA
jgi:antirestriction protein ArdC